MPKLSFENVIDSLGLGAKKDAWHCYWPATDGLADVTDTWLFGPGRLAELSAWLLHRAEIREALTEALAEVLAVPARRALLAQAIRTYSTAQTQPAFVPSLPPEWGAWARLFQALIVLGSVPETRRRHQLRGIPDAITRETFNDVARWMDTYQETHGCFGFTSANWDFNHVSGRLFELGRLQFGRSINDLPFHYFVDGAGGVTALAADALRFRPDGQFLSADKGAEKSGPQFVSEFEINDKVAIGHAVNARGAVEVKKTTLALDRWRRVLEPFSPVIDVHIPAGAPLDDAACAAAFKQAAEFFPRYFPEHVFAGYTCTSWLMDPQLADRLPASANTVKFLRRFHWLPAQGGNDFQTFERVFGGYVDVATAPRDTSMKRAVLEYVEAGGRWRSASGVILRAEIG